MEKFGPHHQFRLLGIENTAAHFAGSGQFNLIFVSFGLIMRCMLMVGRVMRGSSLRGNGMQYSCMRASMHEHAVKEQALQVHAR